MSADHLRILLYGDFRWDRLGASYQRAFQNLGHQVEPLDVRDMPLYLPAWLRHRLGHRGTIHSLRLRRAGSRVWNQHIVTVAKRAQADLTVILNGELIVPETVQALQRLGSRVFILHADNPCPAHSSSRPENLPCARQSDCYFIWSRFLVQQLWLQGVRRVHYLPFAWDPDVFPHLGLSPAPTFDLVFIGGWDRYREQLLEPMARRFDLKVWGPEYWGTRTRAGSPVRRSWQGAAVTGAQAARIIAASRISLNVMRRQNLPDGTVMRSFEIPGCGGFSLSTRTRGATDILPEGVAGAYFGDVAEGCRQIEALWDAARQRQRMARTAHEIVQSGHRYVDRAQRMVDVYREITVPPSTRPAVLPDTLGSGGHGR